MNGMGGECSPYERDCSDLGQRQQTIDYECGNEVEVSLQFWEMSWLTEQLVTSEEIFCQAESVFPFLILLRI
jgi:hypothetical protein